MGLKLTLCCKEFTALVFETQKELDEYLKNLEEAKLRDHRKLGTGFRIL